MLKSLMLIYLLTVSPAVREDSVDVENIYNKVFAIYQSESEPILKELAEKQYKKPNGNDQDYKLLVATRVEVYKTKMSSLKKDFYEGIKNKHFKSDAEAIGYISGYLDFAFRLEFPGFDYLYYERVSEGVAKLLLDPK